MRYILSTIGSEILTFGIIIILAAAGIFLGWGIFYKYQSYKRLEAMTQKFNTAVEIAYEQQKDSDVGGATPYDTLYRYTELLQINADSLASTYFVKEKRSAELHRMDNVSDEQRWNYVLALKADQGILQSQNFSGTTPEINKPLPLVMKKASNGVWQIVSIGYVFAK